MAMLSNPAFGPRVALIYMTVGSLIEVWTGVTWYYFIRPNPEATNTAHFLVTAFLLTGATLMVLGLILGPLGQYARKAELPPKEAEKKEQAIQQTAAANPNPMAAGMAGGLPAGMMPGMAPGMMPGMMPPAPPGMAPACYPAPTPGVPGVPGAPGRPG